MTEKNNRYYMTLNRASEWRRALLYNLSVEGHTVVPDQSEAGTAVIITASADSTEHGFIWRNLLIDAELADTVIMKVSAYAADSTFITVEDRPVELDSYLSDKSVPAEERAKKIAPLFRPVFTNCTDGLLNLTGRYLWLKIEFIMLEDRDVVLKKIKLLLSGEQMIDYLPELYREEDGENGFLTRFLSIFDSIFFDMDEKLGHLGRSLDYRIAEGGMLRFLAEWLSVEDAAYLSDEELRTKIRDAITDLRTIGVKKGLEAWIEREYGVKPNIIEYFDVRGMIYEGKDRDTYRQLFGDNPYKFFVVLPEGVFAGQHETNLFMQRLKKRIPAYTEAEVIVSENNTILCSHTYLGSNTVLSGWSEASLDAGSVLSHDIILGGSEEDGEQ